MNLTLKLQEESKEVERLMLRSEMKEGRSDRGEFTRKRQILIEAGTDPTFSQ